MNLKILKIANLLPRYMMALAEEQGKELDLLGLFGTNDNFHRYYYQYFRLSCVNSENKISVTDEMKVIYAVCQDCQKEYMAQIDNDLNNVTLDFGVKNFNKCKACDKMPIIKVPENEKEAWCDFLHHAVLDLHYDFMGGATLNTKGDTIIKIE